MKKMLLSVCLVLTLVLTAGAQTRPPRPRHRQPARKTISKPRPRDPKAVSFPGDFRFHVLADLGYGDLSAIFMHEIPYHFSVGGLAECQVGRMTSVGIGAEYFSSYGQDCYLFDNMQETYIHAVPLYANLRLTLPRAAVSPFVEGRIGYSIPAGRVTCFDHDRVNYYEAKGLYTGGSVGVKIHRTYLSCGVSVIDVVDSQLGYSGGGKSDVLTDYYVRLSFAF